MQPSIVQIVELEDANHNRCNTCFILTEEVWDTSPRISKTACRDMLQVLDHSTASCLGINICEDEHNAFENHCEKSFDLLLDSVS